MNTRGSDRFIENSKRTVGPAVGVGVGAGINIAPEVRMLEPRETVYLVTINTAMQSMRSLH